MHYILLVNEICSHCVLNSVWVLGSVALTLQYLVEDKIDVFCIPAFINVVKEVRAPCVQLSRHVLLCCPGWSQLGSKEANCHYGRVTLFITLDAFTSLLVISEWSISAKQCLAVSSESRCHMMCPLGEPVSDGAVLHCMNKQSLADWSGRVLEDHRLETL